MPELVSVAVDGRKIADRAVVVQTAWSRIKGLLGRDQLVRGQALVIEPARQIHTFGMRFPIDVLFCDRDGRVVHIVRHMRPNRLSRWVLRARYVVELPADVVSADVAVGETVSVIPL